MRRGVVLAVLVATFASAAPAVAQYVDLFPAQYYGWGVDSVFAVPTGQTARLQLYGSVSGGVSSYSITVYVDTTRLRILGVDSVPGYGLPAPTITREAPDRITLTASGAGYGFGAYLASLLVQAVPGAMQGSLISLRVNSWLTQAGASVNRTTIRTEIENGCIAYALWGDLDSSLTVTGRDALITLTYAVGLPVTGFNLALADVDDDLAVTSRDALLMLARAVRAEGEYYYYRAGVPVVGRCAPLAGVPSEMAFLRGNAAGNLYRVPAGDSTAVAVGSQTGFYNAHRVDWSPDGTKILATAWAVPGNYYFEPIAVTLATLVEDTLARNTAYDGGGAYSPDGTQIAFFSARSSPYNLWLMGSDGANPVQAQVLNSVTNISTTNAAWHPNSAAARVAFTGYPAAAGTNGLWTLRVDSGTVRLEFPASSSYLPLYPSWSPAGDSLLFNANNRVYAVSAPDTATVPRETVSLSGNLDWASWTGAGVVFRRRSGNTYDYYLKRNDGRILRIFRSAGTGDAGAAFR